MERLFKEQPVKKLGGGLKDRPQCERCGRPIRISSEDYLRDELLCAGCAKDVKALELESEEQIQA